MEKYNALGRRIKFVGEPYRYQRKLIKMGDDLIIISLSEWKKSAFKQNPGIKSETVVVEYYKNEIVILK